MLITALEKSISERKYMRGYLGCRNKIKSVPQATLLLLRTRNDFIRVSNGTKYFKWPQKMMGQNSDPKMTHEIMLGVW